MKNERHIGFKSFKDTCRVEMPGSCSGNYLLNRGNHGFSLIELIVIMVLIGVLVTIAIPTYTFLKERARESACLGDIRTIDKEITAYQIDMTRLPDTLGDLGLGALRDPWGNAYQYQKLAGGLGTPYEDPIGDDLNTDYDLFSKGKDASSDQSLTVGHVNTDDDIIRGRDGLYLGRGEDFF